MAEYLDKVTIQTAVRPFKDFDLSCQQLTTSNFMKPTIPYIKEFPKAKIKCNLKSYARLMPLERPVLGSVQVYNRAFFVPLRTVWQPFSAFITNSPYVTDSGTQVLQSVPTISVVTILNLLNSCSTVVTGDDAFDYLDVQNQKRVLDGRGRHFFKIFRQLGYPVVQSGKGFSRLVSALPLLSFAKVFMDWYFPSQYANLGVAASVNQILQRRYYYELNMTEVSMLLTLCEYSYYKNDYFTSVWDSPVAPNLGTYDAISIPDITNPYGNNGNTVHMFSNNGSPYMGQASASSTVIGTQYSHDSLKALTNYVKRHQLVGSRVLDRYLADFGVHLESEQVMRSVYIGTQNFPIQFSDVMSNSDTSGAVLGEYAGKGVAYDGAGNFEYDCEEYGYFMIVNEIIPDIVYYQGYDRNVDHLGYLDFFQPEFESLGTQVVKLGELNSLFRTNEPDSSGNLPMDNIFGYLPRYSEYRVGRDSVTGDFLLNSRNVGLMGFSTVRDMFDFNGAHSIDFCHGTDNLQYQRIFYGDQYSDDDNFIFVHRINIKAAMQMSPQYDTYDFDEKFGETIHMQANGTKLT